jgi:hypothetical protein
MRREQSGEPDGFIAEIGAQQRFALVRRVAFVENALFPNLAFAANQTLRDGGFLHEKGACNLPRTETGHGLERQSDTQLAREAGMTAQKHHGELVIVEFVMGFRHSLLRKCAGELRNLFRKRGFAADGIERAVFRHLDQPG